MASEEKTPPKYDSEIEAVTNATSGAIPRRSARLNNRRHKSHSPGTSRQSSRRSSTASAIVTPVLENGWEKTIIPVMAGTRMGLDPEKYSEEEKRLIKNQIREEGRKENLRRNFLAELRKIEGKKELLDHYNTFDKDLDTVPPVSQSIMREIQKDLRTTYPHLLSSSSKKLNSFLNSFVGLANLHSINMKQLELVFPQFFDDTLQRTLTTDIHRIGLPSVIRDLRQLVCVGMTMSQCHEKLDNFKLDNNNLLFSIYQLKGLVASAHPGASEQEIQNMTRVKTMTLLPPHIAQESRKENKEYRDRYRVDAYPYDQWQNDLTEIILSKHNQKTVKYVNRDTDDDEDIESIVNRAIARQRKTIPTDDLDRAIQTAFEKHVNIISPQTSKFKPVAPHPATAVNLSSAQKEYTHKDLLSDQEDYSDTTQRKLPYKLIAGTFKPAKPIKQAPQRPIFMTFPNTGKNVINRAILTHFRGRCSSCGMTGHTADHEACVYANGTPTWNICSRCGTGFHAPSDCIIDLATVLPPNSKE